VTLAFFILGVLQMTDLTNKPLFSLGELVATPGALKAMNQHNCLPVTLLQKHLSGDWGSVGAEDAKSNDEAVTHGDRILSSYRIGEHTRIWIITEWDRSVTTILLPSEY
jgi:hypothetical protein